MTKANLEKSLVLGLDFGTDSVRALIVRAENGESIATAESRYKRWAKGLYCDPIHEVYRQHPLDYIESLEEAIRNALACAPAGSAQYIVGIGVDTTGSTPVAVDDKGVPLALKPEFESNPDAMFILWKDHSAASEAALITEKCKAWAKKGKGPDYSGYSGGIYSHEWFFAKILRTIKGNEDVAKAAKSWLEHCDWVPALLCGQDNLSVVARSRCSAGHKALWNESWGGLPPQEFFNFVDEAFNGIRQNLFTDTQCAGEKAGELSDEWAKRLGLPANISVSVGAFDAHMGAVGAGAVAGAMCKVMGTSCCDILVAEESHVGNKLVPGICGQVSGSVLPNYIGLEAGQSAFGDAYAWLKDLLAWPLEILLKDQPESKIQDLIDQIIPALSLEAEKLAPGCAPLHLVGLDWLNGRRSPIASAVATGAFTGLTLGVTAPMLFRSLVEATAFGAKAVMDTFQKENIPVREVIALGGIAKKSPFIMQVMADVLGLPVKVSASSQSCALGAAIFAATAANCYASAVEAQKAMAAGFTFTFSPKAENRASYEALYQDYIRLGRFADPSFTLESQLG